LTEKTIAIIGAGIAGLSAGCYGCMNGYDVEIFESHDKPGGMCTAWTRKDYVFDFCIHNLAGTAVGSAMHGVWRELGALDGRGVINRDEFVRVEVPGGGVVHWYTDLDRLGTHLKEIAREDSEAIDDMLRAVRRFARADLLSMPLGGTMRMLRVLPSLPIIRRWSRLMMSDYAQRLKSPVLRRALPHMMYDVPGDELPVMPLLLFSAGLWKGDLGWPVGGSLPFSEAIEKRFVSLGGRVNYRARVEKIVVENDRAVGIRLSDGSERRADYVVSAADGYATIFRMLEGKYVTEPIRKYYESAGDVGPFGLIVYLGLKGNLADAPHALTLVFDEPIDVGGLEQDSMHAVCYGPETGLAPEGKSILKIEVQASYSYWKTRRDADLKTYREEKTRIADGLIDRLAPRFPGLRAQIEVVDVCTPPTSERYTGNRYGWQAGPPKENEEEIQRKGLSNTLPGLEGFYHVGQWAGASLGISTAAISGRNMVKTLCKRDGRRFMVLST
jgi:phytoene dehydrogenase-like protein